MRPPIKPLIAIFLLTLISHVEINAEESLSGVSTEALPVKGQGAITEEPTFTVAARESVLKIVNIYGTVEVKSPLSPIWAEVKSGQELYMQDSIRTGPFSNAKL